MFKLEVKYFVLSSLLLIAANCATEVNVGDRMPPIVRVSMDPDQSFSDGSPYSEPIPDGSVILIDPDRVMPDETLPRIPVMYFSAEDPESGIGTISLRITAELTCRSANNDSWTAFAGWTVSHEAASGTGETDFVASNVITYLSPEAFWRSAGCNLRDGFGQPIQADRGHVTAVRGRYNGQACNNSTGASDAERCARAYGEFEIRGDHRVP